MIFCLYDTFLDKQGALKFPMITVNWSACFQFEQFFASCILTFCCYMHTHLGLLYLLGELSPLSLCNISLCLWLSLFWSQANLKLNSTFLVLPWYIFLHSFTSFLIYVFLKFFSCRQQITGSCFHFFNSIWQFQSFTWYVTYQWLLI